MISFEHHSKLDILSHSLHFDFLCFDVSMDSWVSLRPYVIDISTPNHSAQETSEALSLDNRLPPWVPIGPKHPSIIYHDNIYWHVCPSILCIFWEVYSAEISSDNVTKPDPLWHIFLSSWSKMHHDISCANNIWAKPKKHLIITNMYYITQNMQLKYKMSLHDVQITSWKNHAINYN